MRTTYSAAVEAGRYKTHPAYATQAGDRCGAFRLRAPTGTVLTILASDGSDWAACGLSGVPWEHVSVSTPTRCPTWAEMDWVKDLFFPEDETVIQFHPPKRDWISYHDFTLHLWRPVGGELPRPPGVCVGPAGK